MLFVFCFLLILPLSAQAKVHTSSIAGFTVDVPEYWEVEPKDTGNILAFTTKSDAVTEPYIYYKTSYETTMSKERNPNYSKKGDEEYVMVPVVTSSTSYPVVGERTVVPSKYGYMFFTFYKTKPLLPARFELFTEERRKEYAEEYIAELKKRFSSYKFKSKKHDKYEYQSGNLLRIELPCTGAVNKRDYTLTRLVVLKSGVEYCGQLISRDTSNKYYNDFIAAWNSVLFPDRRDLVVTETAAPEKGSSANFAIPDGWTIHDSGKGDKMTALKKIDGLNVTLITFVDGGVLPGAGAARQVIETKNDIFAADSINMTIRSIEKAFTSYTIQQDKVKYSYEEIGKHKTLFLTLPYKDTKSGRGGFLYQALFFIENNIYNAGLYTNGEVDYKDAFRQSIAAFG